MQEIEVHPEAALWPMMPDDELAALAEDIKINGLRFALTLDRNGRLVDGRNRLKACELADVAPIFETDEGSDDEISALIWSRNEHRRHVSKGQRAMIAAMRDPKGGRGKKQGSLVSASEYERDLVSRARLVLKYAPDLAPQVRDGTLVLQKAYENARLIQETIESTEAVTARLHKEAPHLAALVIEEQLTLPAALAALDEEQRQAKLKRANLFEHLAKAIYFAEVIQSAANIEHAARTLAAFPGEFESQQRFSIDRFSEVIEELPALLKNLSRKLKEERRWQKNAAPARVAAE